MPHHKDLPGPVSVSLRHWGVLSKKNFFEGPQPEGGTLVAKEKGGAVGQMFGEDWTD